MFPTTKAEALLEERAGYVARGMKDRVAQVDAELEALGLATEPAAPDEYPTRGSEKDVLAYVDADPELRATRAEEALAAEAEKGDKARSRLTAKLEAILAD